MRKFLIAAAAVFALSTGNAQAAGGEYHPDLKNPTWSFEGFFGQYDKKTTASWFPNLQRSLFFLSRPSSGCLP